MPEPLSKLRARHALERIERHVELQQADPKQLGKYVSYIKGLPASILKNGLGQAMAMERMGAAKDTGHALLYQDVQDWLLTERGPSLFPEAHPARAPAPADLFLAIVHLNTTEADYIRAQAEALAYLEWLKKFAVAFLTVADEQATTKDGT